MLYMPEAITADDGSITIADTHLQICRDAREWALLRRSGSNADPSIRPRYAYISPRESGKSTWVFKIIPIWALVFAHAQFVAAFADSGTQASEHLQGIRDELRTNRLLQEDAPALCTPKTRGRTVAAETDNKFEYYAGRGVIKARGIDSSILGMKVGNMRPDLIILDDVEKGEARYSVAQAATRLKTIQDVVFPLRLSATVLMAGTTTMAGGIMDDLARAGADGGDAEPWIEAEKIAVRYMPALAQADGGGLRSVWPGKWPLEWLLEEKKRSPRSFAKNFDNSPLDDNGIYFDPDDFRYGPVAPVSFTILSVDPAVSKKSTSDFTGLSVISYSRAQDKFGIRYACKVRLGGKQLKARVQWVLSEFPEITSVLVETNQGGDLWTDEDGVFHGLGNVKIITVHQNLSKELRAETAAAEFTNHKVFFETPNAEAERDLAAFPGVLHDDLVDSITSGIIEIRSRVRNDRKSRQAAKASVVVKRASYA